MTSYRNESYPEKIYTFTEAGCVPLTVQGCTIYLPHASVVDVTFSGSITVPNLELGELVRDGPVGLRLSIEDVLSPGSPSLAHAFPLSSLSATFDNAVSVCVATTYAWTLCSGTYTVRVYLCNDSDSSFIEALSVYGELSIGISKR